MCWGFRATGFIALPLGRQSHSVAARGYGLHLQNGRKRTTVAVDKPAERCTIWIVRAESNGSRGVVKVALDRLFAILGVRNYLRWGGSLLFFGGSVEGGAVRVDRDTPKGPLGAAEFCVIHVATSCVVAKRPFRPGKAKTLTPIFPACFARLKPE
jgi:hypothetical protein